jgi:hypothetical protein
MSKGVVMKEETEKGTPASAAVKVKPKAKKFVAVNTLNQAFDFLVRGRWVRWEPRGMDGSEQELSSDEAANKEFRAVTAGYITIKEAAE